MKVQLILSCLLTVALTGCSERQPAPCPCECPPAGQQLLSTELMARLSAARSYHHQADIHLRAGDTPQAISTLRKLLRLDLDARWSEAEEVRLDATARLAKLLLRREELDAAQKLVELELAKKPRPSFYHANLHSVRGDVLEARAKALDTAGNKERARTVARDALAAFEESIQMNKALQRRLKRQQKAAGEENKTGKVPVQGGSKKGGSR